MEGRALDGIMLGIAQLEVTWGEQRCSQPAGGAVIQLLLREHCV
jgi:hypothetical protein